MRSALRKVDGVNDIDVDYEAKTATVHFDGNIDPAQFIAALEDAGYGVSGTY